MLGEDNAAIAYVAEAMRLVGTIGVGRVPCLSRALIGRHTLRLTVRLGLADLTLFALVP